MGFPFSVPHVAPLDSAIGEWDRRCRVCSKPWAHTTSILGLYGWQEIASTPVAMSKRAIIDTTDFTTVSYIFNRSDHTKRLDEAHKVVVDAHILILHDCASQGRVANASRTPVEGFRQAWEQVDEKTMHALWVWKSPQ